MDPNYQPGQLPTTSPPAQQPPQSGQYDFITSPGKSPKRSLLSFGKGSKSGLLIIVAGGLGLLTAILLIGSLFFGGSSDKQTLLNVAQKQSEVIAVARLGVEDSGTAQAQGLALAVQLSLETQQQGIVAQIAKKSKVKDKDYAATPSASVTSQLETAQRNGRFDDAFIATIKQELTEYQQSLQAANKAATSKSTKELLASDFDGVSLLLSIPTN